MNAAIDFLQKELTEQVKKFDFESKRHKEMYRRLKYITYALTGISTILASMMAGGETLESYLGLEINFNYLISIVIVFTTASIGIVSALDGLRKPGELWVMERNLHHAMRDLKTRLLFELENNPEKIEPEAYFNTMQDILQSANEKWSGKILGAIAGSRQADNTKAQ